MKFFVKNSLTEEEITKGLSRITIDGYISQVMVVLTTGPFLIAFTLLLGASYFIIGLLAAIPPLCQLFQIIAIQLVEKYRNRRSITIISLIFYRISILCIALIPILVPITFGLMFLIIFIILQSIFSAIGHTAWWSWMHDLIPKDKLGFFYSRRMMLSNITAMIVSVLAAFYLDYLLINHQNIEIEAYSLLFFIGFIFGIISIFIVSKVPEPKMKEFKNMSFSKRIFD
ncbi:MAG: MFS transporter [Promethearchaeota archaeon]